LPCRFAATAPRTPPRTPLPFDAANAPRTPAAGLVTPAAAPAIPPTTVGATAPDVVVEVDTLVVVCAFVFVDDDDVSVVEQLFEYDFTACTSTKCPFFPHTLCGWLLPGPFTSVPAGAPLLLAICAAVVPFP
jgi:hypothetical protein